MMHKPSLRAVFLSAFAFLLLLSFGHRATPQSTQDAASVKAAFLYRFLLFVDYPESALSKNTETLSICVFGHNPFGRAFEPVAGKRLKGRILDIRSIPATSNASAFNDCRIVFFGKENPPDSVKKTLTATRGSPILTVGEHEEFLTWGGMIRLFLEREHISFDVNAAAARHSGITFRAQMLRVAKTVLD